MTYVFWGSLVWLVYVLVAYPSLIAAIGLRSRKQRPTAQTPNSVSVVVAVHNGENIIGKKIQHLLGFAADYDFFEVIIASDGSTDRTEKIVGAYAAQGVQLLSSPGRIGKTRALDEAVKLASGEILVFCDASGAFSPTGLAALVDRFAEPDVGCVGGYVNYGKHCEGGAVFRAFKRTDLWMKRGEGYLGYVPAVSGAVHAIRRELYSPGDPAASRDILDPAQVVSRGYRCVYEPDAVLTETSRAMTATHFKARVRMTVRGMTSAALVLRELTPAGRPLTLAIFVSHKVLRWWLWIPFLALLASSITLASASVLGDVAMFGLAALAGLGGCGLLLGDRAPAVLSAPAFLIRQTAAMMVGTVRWLMGRAEPAWEVEA